MSAVLIVTGAGVAVKAWWFCVVAAVWVLLYRAAFPAGEEAEAETGAADSAAVDDGPVVDTRPRVRCPRCAEPILTEARLCRFCGYRFAERLENP